MADASALSPTKPHDDDLCRVNGKAKKPPRLPRLLPPLRDADASVDALRLHEAHGTGTLLGDPVEVASEL